MHRASRVATVVALLAGETAALVTLQRLGRVAGFALPRHGAGKWVLQAPTEDLFAVAARLLGLGLAWWLLAATGLSIARRVVPGWRRLRALDRLTPTAVRHALDRALVLGMGASLGLASIHPAGAAGMRSARSVPRPARDVPVVRSPAPAPPPEPPEAPASSTPTAAPAAPAAPPGPRVVVVRAGDNLWVIARRAVQTGGASGDAAEIAPYWRRVVDLNTATLRSRDPNLIFPGERVVLPPLPPRPAAAGGVAPG